MGILKANIVLTGGPCAGKTITINRVKDDLEQLGFHVLLLSECATEVINSGIRPFGDNGVSVFDFQNEVLNLQLYKEKRFLDIINKLSSDSKCIILCDRGILDNKAYLGEELFDELLEYNNLDSENLLNRYDLVLHLVTVAADVKDKYDTTSNIARFEDADNAILIDKGISDAWHNHPNIKVIKVTDDFDEKVDRVIKVIHDFLKIEK